MKSLFDCPTKYECKQYIRMYASIEFIKASIVADNFSLHTSPEDVANLAVEYSNALINKIMQDVRSNNNK